MKKKTPEQQVFLVIFLLTLNQFNSFISVFVANLKDIFVSFVIITKYENNYGFVLSSRVFACDDKILWRIFKIPARFAIAMTVIRRTRIEEHELKS